jgi:putative ABC transport system ATP-binding protein
LPISCAVGAIGPAPRPWWRPTLIGVADEVIQLDHRRRVRWSPPAAGDPPPWTTVSVVPQLLAIIENLTVVLRAHGVAPAEAHRRASSQLERLDLAEFARRWPRELSTGQRQRLAVARALVQRPRLVLADEPTSHQDAVHGQTVMDAVHDVVAGGAAALITGHDPAVARQATALVTLT